MVSLIVAHDVNNAIGKNGKIPWTLKEDLAHFKSLTIGNVVIFGRKTFESINHALPNRINIVISSTKNFSSENLYTVSSLKEALDLAEKVAPDKKVFICGGEGIYKESLPFVSEMYITYVDIAVKNADAFFPEVSLLEYTLLSKKDFPASNCNPAFSILYYKKK